MPNARVLLYKHRIDKEGRHPVMLQTKINGVLKRKTLCKVRPDEWNSRTGRINRTHPDAGRLNKYIFEELNRANNVILDASIKGIEITAEDVMTRQSSDLFSAIADEYISTISYHGTARKYRNLVDKVNKFKPNLALQSIDETFMKSFASWLRSQPTINSPSTVHYYIKFLKAILRYAMKRKLYDNDDAIDFTVKLSYKVPVVLTIDELRTLKSKQFDKEELTMGRDMFMAMVYLWGIRVGDLLQLHEDQVINDEVHITARKTGKMKVIEVSDDLRAIFDRYRGRSAFGYIFPLLDVEKKDHKRDVKFNKAIESKTTIINNHLKEIAAACEIRKNLTSKVARHTFSMLMDTSGATLTTIQHMLDHTSASTTDAYLRGIRKSKELSSAASKGLDLI